MIWINLRWFSKLNKIKTMGEESYLNTQPDTPDTQNSKPQNLLMESVAPNEALIIKYISKELTEITGELRSVSFVEKLPNPDDLKMNSQEQSIGAFAAYYYPSRCEMCVKKESCLPCGYTNLELGIPNKKIVDSAIRQFESLFVGVDRFEKNVIKNQYGKIYAPRVDNPIGLTLSPTGSWFGNELPPDARTYMLQGLVDEMKEYPDLNLVLYIEAHALDVVREVNTRSFDTGASKEEIDLLKSLNTHVVLGYESRSKFVRNALYNKKLTDSNFDIAVEGLKEQGLEVGAFVFCGLPPMTDIEAKKDVLDTCDYLSSKGVFPVLMFANIQPNTIPELLYINGEYKMLEPFTVADTIAEMLKISLLSKNQNWLIPDPVGGPPDPEFNIFINRNDTASSNDTNQILLEMLRNLRNSRDVGTYLSQLETLHQTDEYKKYEEELHRQEKEVAERSLLNRTLQMIAYMKSPGVIKSYMERQK